MPDLAVPLTVREVSAIAREALVDQIAGRIHGVWYQLWKRIERELDPADVPEVRPEEC